MKDDAVKVHLSFNPMQSLFGRAYFHIVTLDKNKKKRIVYKGVVPKLQSHFTLQDTQNQQHTLTATYQGNFFGGDISLPIDDLEDSTQFYIQLGQGFGPFEESDSIYFDHTSPPFSRKGIVAIIPCYNVSGHCKSVIDETLSYAEKIIAVDDGSSDGTKEILKKLAEEHPNQIIFLDNPKNRGKGYCLLDGFRYAVDHLKFDALITLDSDSQHKPSEIPKLSQAIIEGEDFVIGSRCFKKMPMKNRFANTLITVLLRQLFPHAPHDTQSGYRGFSKLFLEELLKKAEGGQYEMEFHCLLFALSKNKRVRSLPISTIYINDNASSHFSAFKDSGKILKVLLHYGTKKERDE